MISKEQIAQIVRQRDFTLNDVDIDRKTDSLYEDIIHGRYSFSNYTRDIFTQQGKKRIIYNYMKLSCEDIICQYLKHQIDSTFHVKYASRNKIMNLLFNVLPIVKDMNDFVIVRADFKSFFDSVLLKHIYDKYIKESMLKRYDKEMLALYTREFKYCYAGLCLSNSMTELACSDFDEHIKAKLSQYGVFFYERYVDDILLIMNKYISQDIFLGLMNEAIKEVFGESPVHLAMTPGKFSYIAKRNIQQNKKYEFSFLGYEFELKEIQKEKDSMITFRYGITEKKRRKYGGIIEKAIIQYSKDHDMELFRQRIKIYSARVVLGKKIGSSSLDWLTKGVVANYNELQHHMKFLTPDTKMFMKGLYFALLGKHHVSIPYFMEQSAKEDSIYNIYSNMKRNRSIVFEENIGVPQNVLIKWIRKIDPHYKDNGKDYYRIVVDYLEMIKIE